jgi:hypothetical protein
MPQFNVDLSPKNQPTSLADLLKLQVYSYQGDIAQQEAAKAKAVGAELPIVQSFFKDTKNWQNDQGEIDVDKINSALPVLAPLTGQEYAAKYNTLAKNNIEAKDAKLNFDQKERQVVASVQSALGYAGVTDPRVYIDKFNNLKSQFPESKNIHRFADAAISNLQIGAEASRGKPNPDLPKNAIQAANEMLSLTEQQSRFAPSAEANTIAGQTVAVVKKPFVASNVPSVEAVPLGDGSGTPTPATNKEQKPTKPLRKIINEDESLKFVPNASGIVNLNDYQKNAYTIGDKLVTNTIASAQIPKDLQQNVRNVEELLKSASGSKLGQKFTQGLGWVFENPKLDELIKNLAQVQARNAAVMGLDKTDSSRELNAKLSGSEKISPEALKEIMKQVKAESTAAEMFSQGLNKFLDKRGDINGKIQAQKFESAWKENYDPRIFQMRNISTSNLSATEKQNRIHEITSKMTPKELEQIKEKSSILHDLSIGNFQ